MDTLIIHSEPQKTVALLEILKSFGVTVELKKQKKTKEYDPAFVKMVLEASKQKESRVLNDEYKKELFGSL